MKKEQNWFWSPEKNYLGHWDIPVDSDLILTIVSAKWETVKDPKTGKEQLKRIVRFKEHEKPFICNQTNAESIAKATDSEFFDNSYKKKVALYRAKIVDGKSKEEISCIRIRDYEPKVEKLKPITKEEIQKAVAYYQKHKNLDEWFKVRTITKNQEEQIKKLANEK